MFYGPYDDGSYSDDNYQGPRRPADWTPQHHHPANPQPLSPTDHRDLELMFSGDTPQPARVDVYLRRALMIGAVILVWTAAILAIGWLLNMPEQTSKPGQPRPSQSTLLNTEKPLIGG